jgi:hypothetical protein
MIVPLIIEHFNEEERRGIMSAITATISPSNYQPVTVLQQNIPKEEDMPESPTKQARTYNRKRWTEEEDIALRAAVTACDGKHWKKIASRIPG